MALWSFFLADDMVRQKRKEKKRTIKGYGSAAKGEDTFIYQR
jgi:hypothetical protein